VRDTPGQPRYVEWRYKPGQRMQLRVPVEEWPERIVLPTEAVAQEGVENYVFRANGDHFDRQAVHVEHRDSQSVVIANDGALFPGERIAMSAAQQLQLALKNKAHGAIDPHAGHSH
jgi:membrane fusion protein, heavy metal efflux system